MLRLVLGILLLAVTATALYAFPPGAESLLAGKVRPPPVIQGIASTAISCGSGCSFTAGTGSTVGTLSATLTPSSPGFAGTWSRQTAGTVGGHACDTSAAFSISGNSLSVSSSGIAGTFYECYVATQAGLTGSPFPNVVAVTGNNPVVGSCGSAPVGAAAALVSAAQFNHCAVYSDFTTALPNTVGTGLPTPGCSNIACSVASNSTAAGNWINCNGTPGGNPWHWGYYNSNTPCSYITQQNDPVVGGLALNINVPASQNFFGCGSTCQPVPILSGSNSTGYSYSAGYYVELTFRIDNNPNGASAVNWWSEQSLPVGSFPCVPTNGDNRTQEVDFIEFSTPSYSNEYPYQNSGCSASGAWFHIEPYPISGNDPQWSSQYNTIGFLETNNGNDTFADVMFFNGTVIYSSGQYVMNPGYATALTHFILFDLGYGNSTQYGMWIRDAKIWSCASWSSSACAGNAYDVTSQIYTGAGG